MFEDNEAVCHWVTAAGKIAQVPQNLYFYRTNPDSTTQKSFSLKKLDFLWAMEQIIHFYGTAGYEQIRRRFFERYVRETGTCWRMVRYSLGQPGEAGKLKKNLKTLLKKEKLSLNREQKEYLLDAMHPVLIRLYWPAAGLADTLRQEGVPGIAGKIKKHLGGRQS